MYVNNKTEPSGNVHWLINNTALKSNEIELLSMYASKFTNTVSLAVFLNKGENMEKEEMKSWESVLINTNEKRLVFGLSKPLTV